jgi:hypothetical protein
MSVLLTAVLTVECFGEDNYILLSKTIGHLLVCVVEISFELIL